MEQRQSAFTYLPNIAKTLYFQIVNRKTDPKIPQYFEGTPIFCLPPRKKRYLINTSSFKYRDIKITLNKRTLIETNGKSQDEQILTFILLYPGGALTLSFLLAPQ